MFVFEKAGGCLIFLIGPGLEMEWFAGFLWFLHVCWLSLFGLVGLFVCFMCLCCFD